MSKEVNIQLGILVTTVSLEVLSDRDGLLDEVVEVLGDGWGEACKVSSGFLNDFVQVHPPAAVPATPSTVQRSTHSVTPSAHPFMLPV